MNPKKTTPAKEKCTHPDGYGVRVTGYMRMSNVFAVLVIWCGVCGAMKLQSPAEWVYPKSAGEPR